MCCEMPAATGHYNFSRPAASLIKLGVAITGFPYPQKFAHVIIRGDRRRRRRRRSLKKKIAEASAKQHIVYCSVYIQ
jgi:hypothetical protein